MSGPSDLEQLPPRALRHLYGGIGPTHPRFLSSPLLKPKSDTAHAKLMEGMDIDFSKRRSHTVSTLPLNEDVLQSLVCNLSIRNAARAARVCRQWYHAATPIAYTHIFLHTGSWNSASALSRTLLQCAHLRRHVKHLTAIHCARYSQYMGNLLYVWLSLVPEGSLRSCRAIGGAGLVSTLLASPAVRAAPDLAVLTVFYKTSDAAVPHVEVLKCIPEHSRVADSMLCSPDSSHAFLRDLIPHFRVHWGPDARNTLYLSIASPAVDGGVSLSHLEDFLTSLDEHLTQANFVVLSLGYTSRPLPTGREVCEAGLAQVTRRPSRCQCASTPNRFAMDVPSDAPAVCAALLGGQPFPAETVRSMLEGMDAHHAERGRPVWAHVAILRVAGVPRGRVCGTCGIQLYAVFQPSLEVQGT